MKGIICPKLPTALSRLRFPDLRLQSCVAGCSAPKAVVHVPEDYVVDLKILWLHHLLSTARWKPFLVRPMPCPHPDGWVG